MHSSTQQFGLSTTYSMPSQERSISSSTDHSKQQHHQLHQTGNHPTIKIPYKKACDRPAVTVARRNARERKRVHTVNQMFNILKCRLPSLQHKTKRVSKLKILKAAMEYIYDLQDILDAAGPATMTPATMPVNRAILTQSSSSSATVVSSSSSSSQQRYRFEHLHHQHHHHHHHHHRNYDPQVDSQITVAGEITANRSRSSAATQTVVDHQAATTPYCDSSRQCAIPTVHSSNRDPPPLSCFQDTVRNPRHTIHHLQPSVDYFNEDIVYDSKFYHCEPINEYGNHIYH